MTNACDDCPPLLVLTEGLKIVGLLVLVVLWIFLSSFAGRRV
jgi:hypothetical protein